MKTNQKLLKDLSEEQRYLADKYEKLKDFFATDDYQVLPWEHKRLLLQQSKEMFAYMLTLTERIEYVKSTTTGFESIFEEFFKGAKDSSEKETVEE